MKKLINLYKNGETYQIGALTNEEAQQIKTDVANASAKLQNVYTKTETDNEIDTKIQGLNVDWVGTLAQYNALTEKKPNTMYWIIQEDVNSDDDGL